MKRSYKKQMGAKIEKSMHKEQWEKAKHNIRIALKKFPNDHWLLTQLSAAHYGQKKYKQALTLSKKALKDEPKCPLVLWDYASALYKTGKIRKALSTYTKLVKRGAKAIAYGQCGEGKSRAISLVNDSLYEIALCHKKLGNKPKAIKFYREYLAGRKMGISSIYDKRHIDREYQKYIS